MTLPQSISTAPTIALSGSFRNTLQQLPNTTVTSHILHTHNPTFLQLYYLLGIRAQAALKPVDAKLQRVTQRLQRYRSDVFSGYRFQPLPLPEMYVLTLNDDALLFVGPLIAYVYELDIRSNISRVHKVYDLHKGDTVTHAKEQLILFPQLKPFVDALSLKTSITPYL